MPSPTRLLQSSSHSTPADPPIPLAFDSDVVVVLAALLCALVCVLGLGLASRCSFFRRSAGSSSSSSSFSFFLPPNKGIKKKALQSLPTVPFAATGGKIAECAICLTEFSEGDRIRILPQCGHGFHVACVDTWLRAHSTCPSCRRVLVVTDSSMCCASSKAVEVDPRDGGGCSRFLP
ncbi:RING-H2 finger protein ATL80-like [Typha latifolia]|uniref:RING-H2 finger protein ATL80-like n=1 Tax=Typha latifolia TaxID=4733 RepID=UPI003C2C3FE6